MALPTAPLAAHQSDARARSAPAGLLALLGSPPLVLAAFLALAAVLFITAWGSPFSRVIGVGPDPPVFLWYLRWMPFALGHGLNPLFTTYLDYPAGVNVMWQTSVPLLTLLLSPITTSLGAVFAYNLLLTSSVALAAWGAFLAIRRHVRRPWTAIAGGLLFGFSPYMLTQSLGHPHMAFSALCPLFLLLFEEAVISQARPSWQLGVALGLLAAAQLLIAEEMLLTEVVVGLMALAILAFRYAGRVRAHASYLGKVVLIGTATAAPLVAVPLWFQFFGPQAVHGVLPTANLFVTDVAGFVLPASLQAVAPAGLAAISGRLSGTQYEAGAYLGLPLIALLGYGVWHLRRLALVQVAAAMLLLTAALSLGVTIHVAGVSTGVPAALVAVGMLPLMRHPIGRLLPLLYALAWTALATVPVFTNIVPDRLMVYVTLFAALLTAIVLDRVALAWPARPTWTRVAVVGVAGLAGLTLLPAFPFPTSPVEVPKFFVDRTQAAAPDGGVLLVVPYAHDFESRAMLWQLSSGMAFRMPEGYANRPGPALDPPASELGQALIGMEYGMPAPVLTPSDRARMMAELRSWHADAVALGPMEHRQAMAAFISAAVGREPVSTGGVLLWPLGQSQGSQISLADWTSVIHQRPSMSTSV